MTEPAPPTQVEIEQAPAKRLLADIREQKSAETVQAILELFPSGPASRRAMLQNAALKLFDAIREGRIPNVTFNAL